jgi:hypothetical protein
MWHELAQRYAIQAREFSDAVAALGRQAHVGPQACKELLEIIRTRREACIAVADELDRHLMQKARTAGMGSPHECSPTERVQELSSISSKPRKNRRNCCKSGCALRRRKPGLNLSKIEARKHWTGTSAPSGSLCGFRPTRTRFPVTVHCREAAAPFFGYFP